MLRKKNSNDKIVEINACKQKNMEFKLSIGEARTAMNTVMNTYE